MPYQLHLLHIVVGCIYKVSEIYDLSRVDVYRVVKRQRTF